MILFWLSYAELAYLEISYPVNSAARLPLIMSLSHMAMTIIIRYDPPLVDLNDLSIHGGAFKKVIFSS